MASTITAHELSPLQRHLLQNLHKLQAEEKDEKVDCWLPDEVNNTDRFPGFVTKTEIVRAMKEMQEQGLVEGVKVLYSAWLKWRLTPAGESQTDG